MRTQQLILLTLAAALMAPATAAADFQHVISPGESLTSVATADGLSVSQLAAANGLSPEAELIAGTELAIPPRDAATPPSPVAPAGATSATGGGGYLVQPGDTLSAIAARFGVSLSALAAANGMSINGVLEAGRTLSVSGASVGATSAPVAAAPSAASSPAETSTSGAQPTDQMVTASDIGSIAAAAGVSPSLAEAIGYQESGFNNAEVSATGAIGVMQIEPGTWRDLTGLGGPALAPDSATDNIRGGVELLGSLLDQTGGDAAETAAAYYQGLESVREYGMYPDTRQYVRNVLALQSRFGG